MNPDINKKGIGGIYKIVNTNNGKVYIGRTRCFYRRCHHYVYDFYNRRSNQINEYLLHSMEKHGIDAFRFEPIEMCDVGEMESRELYWMDYYDSCNSESGYNLRRDSEGCMIVHESTRNKISERLKKEWKDGVRDSHSEKLKQSWVYREDDKKKVAENLRKVLTKYKYEVYFTSEPTIYTHKELVEEGFGNVMATFHKKKCDDVTFKGIRIKRIHINEG